MPTGKVISNLRSVVNYRALLSVLQYRTAELMELTTQVLSSAPTNATVGKRGQLAVVTNANPALRAVFVCTDDVGPVYEWLMVGNNLVP